MGSLPGLLSTLFTETAFLAGPGAQDSGVQLTRRHLLAFHVGAEDLSSALHTCMGSALSAELFFSDPPKMKLHPSDHLDHRGPRGSPRALLLSTFTFTPL